MLNIAIVEDDPGYRAEMTGYLDRFSEESGLKFRITEFTDGSEIAGNYTASWDIILMDIEMKTMDGMTAAEKIRSIDRNVVIIFITNMPQYVMKGYTVDALDYVLKPVSYYAFSQRIMRAAERMQRRSRHFISVPIHNGILKLDLAKLCYIEIADHDLIYHTLDEKILSKGSLTELAERLEKDHFFRISNCYLVNLEYVESIRNNEAVVGGETLTVSRTRKKLLMDALNDYINEVSK